jgi:predicted DsbA family dithiol-disulfide isomerase
MRRIAVRGINLYGTVVIISAMLVFTVLLARFPTYAIAIRIENRMSEGPLAKPKSSSLLIFFPTPFLLGLLTLSILTNVIFVVRTNYQSLWQEWLVALAPPPSIRPIDHVRGNPNAKVTVIEYADLQCPFCADFHTTMRTTLKDTNIKWVYRHFPIEQVHPLAWRAAEASECAGAQRFFWQYVDAFFDNQHNLTENAVAEVASVVGLDLTAFGECVKSQKFHSIIVADRNDGVKRRVNATPTFYVNSKRYVGSMSQKDLMQVIADASEEK